jgi:hypothetical protein
VSFIKNQPLRLTDGREVIGTLAAANEIRVTPAYFPKIAKSEGLQRFARRSEKGVVAHFYLVDEIAALKAKRQNLVPEIPADDFVALPFEPEAN